MGRVQSEPYRHFLSNLDTIYNQIYKHNHSKGASNTDNSIQSTLQWLALVQSEQYHNLLITIKVSDLHLAQHHLATIIHTTGKYFLVYTKRQDNLGETRICITKEGIPIPIYKVILD
jgi:hypothetical protein